MLLRASVWACMCCIWTPGFAQSLSVWLNVQTVASSLAPVCPDLCPVSILLNMPLFNLLQVFHWWDFFFFCTRKCLQDFFFFLRCWIYFSAVYLEGEIHVQVKGPFKINKEEKIKIDLYPHPIFQLGLNLVIYEETLKYPFPSWKASFIYYSQRGERNKNLTRSCPF